MKSTEGAIRKWVVVALGYTLLSCEMGQVDNINISKKCFLMHEFCEMICVGCAEGALHLSDPVNHSKHPPHSHIS